MRFFKRRKAASPATVLSPSRHIAEPADRPSGGSAGGTAGSPRGAPFRGEAHEPTRQDWTRTDGGRPWTPATWLAFPTLTHGAGSQYKLAGAYHHRTEIHDAYMRYGGFVMAELRIETEGSFAGAVRAFVNGVQLATVPHQHTLPFQTAVENLGRKGLPATLHVRLEADEYVDVWAFCEPTEREQDEPFLCPQETEEVLLFPGVAEELDQGLKSRARNKRASRLGRLQLDDGGTWSVTLAGEPIGTLTKRRYRRLQQALEAGFPLDVRVEIRRRDGRPLAVSAGFPRDD